MQAKLVQLHHYQEELRMEDIVPSRHQVLCTVPKTNRDPTFCEIGTPSSQNRDPKQRFMKFNA